MKPKLVMMVGLAGSGKSTFAENFIQLNGGYIVSSDKIRGELYGDENCQNNPSKVFEILEKRVKAHLRSGDNAVYDATNLSMKRRKAFLDGIKSIDCEKVCFIVATPFELCVEQDSKRDRKVGYNVIKRQRENFQCPFFYEGWDKIILINERAQDINYLDNLVRELKDVPHDNPHHEYPIGKHMIAAEEYCVRMASFALELMNKEDTPEKDKPLYLKESEQWIFLAVAAKYHDLGKKATKAFFDAKGNPSEVAHFYNHQNVSSYEIISHIGGGILDISNTPLYKENKLSLNYWLNIAVIANWHMQPFFLKAENPRQAEESKSWKKFINVVGEEIGALLIRFHMADLNAH